MDRFLPLGFGHVEAESFVLGEAEIPTEESKPYPVCLVVKLPERVLGLLPRHVNPRVARRRRQIPFGQRTTPRFHLGGLCRDATGITIRIRHHFPTLDDWPTLGLPAPRLTTRRISIRVMRGPGERPLQEEEERKEEHGPGPWLRLSAIAVRLTP